MEVENETPILTTSNMGPMLIDNTEGKPLPKKFKYIDQNFIRPNIRKQFRSKHLLLSCVCQYRYIHVEKADGGVVEEACNDECLNRQIYIECANCEWGTYCTNRNFTKGCQYSLILFSAGEKGWGVKSLDFIKKGSFVVEYNGEIITQEEFHERSIKYENSKSTHFYTMALAENYVIDATCKGNIARFINHSCDPNLMTQLWSVDGYHRMGFFAIKNIDPCTELSFDYNFIRFNSIPQKCYCNAKCCTGQIGRSIMSTNIIATAEEEFLTKKCNKISIKSSISRRPKIGAKDRKKIPIEIQLSPPTPTTNNELNLNHVDMDNNDTLESTDQPLTQSLDSSTLIENITIDKEPDTLLDHIKQFVEDVNMPEDTSIQKFLHYVIRSKSVAHKLQLLDCLLERHTNSCLFEFLRFKLLVLLWSWTTDDEPFDTCKDLLNLLHYREKFMDVLDLFQIPYRNPIEESKLEDRLKEWKTEMSHPNISSVADSMLSDCKRVVEKIENILLKWSGLQRKFKIPKKSESANDTNQTTGDNSRSRLSYDPTAKRRKGSPSHYAHDKRFKSSTFVQKDRKYGYHRKSYTDDINRYKNNSLNDSNHHMKYSNSKYTLPYNNPQSTSYGFNYLHSGNKSNENLGENSQLSNSFNNPYQQPNNCTSFIDYRRHQINLSHASAVNIRQHPIDLNNASLMDPRRRQIDFNDPYQRTQDFSNVFYSQNLNESVAFDRTKGFDASSAEPIHITPTNVPINNDVPYVPTNIYTGQPDVSIANFTGVNVNMSVNSGNNYTNNEIDQNQINHTNNEIDQNQINNHNNNNEIDQNQINNNNNEIDTNQMNNQMNNNHNNNDNNEMSKSEEKLPKPIEKIDSADKMKALDKVYLEKFNHRYIIPNWNSHDANNTKFKDELALHLVDKLKPYYTENKFDDPSIKIHSKMEFKYLAKKITHLILSKELRVIERLTGKTLEQLNQLHHTKPILILDEKIKERIDLFICDFMDSYSK